VQRIVFATILLLSQYVQAGRQCPSSLRDCTSSGMHAGKAAEGKLLCTDSGTQGQSAGTQGLRDSGTQGLRDSGTQGLRDSGAVAYAAVNG
jgi:hypothetical protein